VCLPVNCNVIMRGDKSFAYDLNVQRSIVSSRVALLLRSAEIKLQLSDLSKMCGQGWLQIIDPTLVGNKQNT
jgi:23S rRNA G2445 N2-methylase RlmL